MKRLFKVILCSLAVVHLAGFLFLFSAQEEKSLQSYVVPAGGINFKLGGFVQSWFQWRQDSQTDYLIKNLRIFISGSPSDVVDFNIMPVYASASGVSLLNAYVDVKPAEHLVLRMGQFPFPFGQNRMYGPQQLELANYQSNGKVFPGIVSDLAWDIGAQAVVSYPLFEARIASINGAGPNVISDSDTVKDITARLEIYPFLNKKLVAGGSVYDGTSHNKNTTAPLFADKRTWLGGHVKYEFINDKAVFQGEVISRSDSNRLWVLQLSYKINYWKDMQVVTDYEQFEPSAGNIFKRVTGGINLFIDKKTRLTLNVFNDNDGSSSINNFVTQLQTSF